ncbi:MAG: LysR family transcriptional regulator [Thiobacillus sp.]
MLDDLALFVTIVEAGSLAAAGDKLDIPPATVTRRLQQLEKQLGCRLLNRSARRLQPSPEGQLYYEQCRPLIQGLRQATQRLDDTISSLAGLVRVLAPTNLANGPLAEAWSSFLEQHPQITLDLELSNAMQDLVGSGADLAIRVGKLTDSSLTQRLLGTTRLVLVAAPAYLKRHGMPADPAALAGHRCIVVEPFKLWRFKSADGQMLTLQPTPYVRLNDLHLATALAARGSGILLTPRVQCDAELKSGKLQILLPDYETEGRQIFAVWSQQRYLPARVRALLEHLAGYLAAYPL